MTNYNGQLPPDAEFDSIIPQTINSTQEKSEKQIFDSRNYLDFSIPDGQKTREVTIRLLPVNIIDGKPEFFQIVHLHNIPVNKELNPNKSGKKAYMCLNSKNTGVDHDVYGSKCPICEAQQEIWNQWHNETDVTKKKELAKEAGALNIREYCIVRCIERGKESEGPKFWRIPIRQDQTDAYHKIILLGETRRKEGEEEGVNINIFSIYEGRDLKVTFTEGTGAPTVVDKSVSTPLTKDNDELIKWYYDEKKWSDVFSTKPYDYLKIAFEGEIPWFDKPNNKWVAKTEFDNIKSNQEQKINEEIKNIESKFTGSSNTTPIIENNNEKNISETTPFVKNNDVTSCSAVNHLVDDDDLPF